MSDHLFKGAISALITPLRNGVVDYKALEDLIEWQIQEGIDGLALCGTTGESIVLEGEERIKIVEKAIAVANKRIPIMVGTGAASTKETIMYTTKAQEQGADAALIVTPYYNKPSQDGIIAHFRAINDSVKIPIYIYNNPGRSVIDIADQTFAELIGLDNVCGIKESSASTRKVGVLKAMAESRNLRLNILCGDDSEALAYNAHGADGCVSVMSNIVPKAMAKMQALSREGAHEDAQTIQDHYSNLMKCLFIESNPTPVKYALSLLGKCSAELRLPLVEPLDDTKQKIKDAMKLCGVL